MTEPTSKPGAPQRDSLVREVSLLLAVGLALGVAHNAFLLASGPGKGLAWVRQERRVVKLEDVEPAIPAVDPVVRADVPPPVAPPSPAAVPPLGAPARAAAGASGIPDPARAAQPALPPEAPRPSQGAPGAAGPAASPVPDVPAIPESREPIEAALAIVRRLHAANAAVFVDARTAAEFAEGHIAGAINVSFDDVFRDPKRLEGFPDRGLPVVSYCGSSDCDLSRNLAFSLVDAGLKRVLVFHGGLREWQAAGLAVDRGGQP